MWTWQRNNEEYSHIAETIANNPGVKPGRLAALIGVHRQEIYNRLPSIEASGILLWEDEKGGLHIFKH